MRKKYAVCVGINDYPGVASDLSGCVNDAKDWAEALKARGYEVALILDQSATKKSVIEALRAGLAQCRFGDRFVFTFSGHGTWVPDRDGDEADLRDEALCCHDYSSGGLLTDDEMHAIFQDRSYGVRATVVSDSCHSGTMARFMHTGEGAMGTPKFVSPALLMDDMTEERAVRIEMAGRNTASRPGTVLISGCMDNEYSYDASFGGRPNGALSYFALMSLAGGTSVKSVYGRIREKLPSPFYPQTPQLTATYYQKRTSFL